MHAFTFHPSPPFAVVSERQFAVKAALTPNLRPRRRRRRHVETADFGRMVGRMIRAYARRVQDADREDLAQLVAMRDLLDVAIGDAVRHLREHHEFSWTAIGEAVGTSKQAAQQRYGVRS